MSESSALIASILTSLQDEIAVLDQHGNTVMVNDAWMRFARENDVMDATAVGPGVDYLKVCQDAADGGDELAKAAINGIRSVIDGSLGEFQLEHPRHSPSGERWFLMTVSSFSGREGWVVVLHRSITARKLAERQLMRSEERFRNIMEQSPLAIELLTPEGEISKVNTAWNQLWNITEAVATEVLANYNMLSDQQIIDLGIMSLVERAFAGEAVALPPIEYSANRAKEEMGLGGFEARTRWIQCHLYPIKNEAGDVVQVVNTYMDITELKRSEQKARAQRDALARVERTTMMGQLTGSIAHELNQPLTGILSSAQGAAIMTEKGQLDRDELLEILAAIAADAKRAGEVIRSLRELYRKQKGESLPVDINAVVYEVVELLHSEFVIQNITCTTDRVSATPIVSGNRIQLQQVLVNLIMNGNQAMNDVAPADRRVHIVTTQDGNEATVWVDDNGPGIDPARIDRIFEPLATWKPGGTGMGLAISNSIVEAHGGRMWTENRPKGGARVGFTLPLANGSELT